jgi:hypothetical protein
MNAIRYSLSYGLFTNNRRLLFWTLHGFPFFPAPIQWLLSSPRLDLFDRKYTIANNSNSSNSMAWTRSTARSKRRIAASSERPPAKRVKQLDERRPEPDMTLSPPSIKQGLEDLPTEVLLVDFGHLQCLGLV